MGELDPKAFSLHVYDKDVMSSFLQAWFFAIILVLSISTSNLTFAQSYNNNSNSSTNSSTVICGYDLWGDLYLVEHGTGDSCNSKGSPTLLSKSKGMLSPENIQQLVNRDRQLYILMWLHPANVRFWANPDISKMCQYDKNGNFVVSLSYIQKEVLADLKNNYGMFVCPLTGTPTAPPPPPQTSTGYAKLVGVTPAMPKCQMDEVIMSNVCLSTQTTCPSGFGTWSGNICIFLKPECPSDSIAGNGVCALSTPKCNFEVCTNQVLPLSCPQGTYLNGLCVLTSEIQPTPMLTCPEGYGFQNNSNFCVVSSTLPKRTCPFGTIPQNGMCIASNIRQPIPTSTETNSTNNIPKPSSPSLKQKESGILAKDVQCKQGFVLLVRTETGHPICVKPKTAQKLVERGWGVLKEQLVWFVYNPIACQQTPWAKELANIAGGFIPERAKIDKYFKDQGITVLDAKIWSFHTQASFPKCGNPLDNIFYYFLVPQNDKSKMVGLGSKAVDENEVQGSEVLLPNMINTEQKVWFSFNPIQCHAPWDEYWNKLNANQTHMVVRGSELDVINIYFQDRGITILDARVTIPFTQEPPPQCGHPSQNMYYFLISQLDAKKMADLGYTVIEEEEVCSPKGSFTCINPNQMR